MFSVAGKAGIVTGASRGLGRATALALARGGATVVAVARSEADLQELARASEHLPGEVIAYCADISEEAGVEQMITSAATQYGLNFLVNNAGAQRELTLLETTTEDWSYVHAVNSTAPFWTCKHAVRAMLDRGNGGSIVNVASVLSVTADPLLAAYTASKHALLGLTRSIAVTREYARAGIRCNAVCPGDMDTPMLQQYFESHDDPAAARTEIAATYPAERIGSPEEVAAAIVFLVCDAASLINGTTITVDGGLTAQLYTSG